MDRLTWSAPEYEERERSRDWFWALGIIIVTGSIAAIIFANYFFAVLLVLGGVLLGYFATQKPDMVRYELNQYGLRIRDTLYPYQNITSFWVQAGIGPNNEVLKPILFIRTTRFFLPVIYGPIEEEMAEHIRAAFLDTGTLEQEMREHASVRIMESLGF